ncbi:MAG: hypothetical protein M3R59_08045 [Verrucomicrobiota bacterium]|nr:hypothetical protein [Verrucomicrobiota bacterium]
MKKTLLFTVTIGSCALFLAGCQSPNSGQQTADNANPSKKVYTGDQLQQTGRVNSGPALRRIDPAVGGGSSGY